MRGASQSIKLSYIEKNVGYLNVCGPGKKTVMSICRPKFILYVIALEGTKRLKLQHFCDNNLYKNFKTIFCFKITTGYKCVVTKGFGVISSFLVKAD